MTIYHKSSGPLAYCHSSPIYNNYDSKAIMKHLNKPVMLKKMLRVHNALTMSNIPTKTQ